MDRRVHVSYCSTEQTNSAEETRIMGAGGEDFWPIFHRSPGSPAETSSRQVVGSLGLCLYCVSTLSFPRSTLVPFFQKFVRQPLSVGACTPTSARRMGDRESGKLCVVIRRARSGGKGRRDGVCSDDVGGTSSEKLQWEAPASGSSQRSSEKCGGRSAGT